MTEFDADVVPVFNHRRNELMSAVPDISRWDRASLITSRTVSVALTDNVLVCCSSYGFQKEEDEKNITMNDCRKSMMSSNGATECVGLTYVSDGLNSIVVSDLDGCGFRFLVPFIFDGLTESVPPEIAQRSRTEMIFQKLVSSFQLLKNDVGRRQ